MSSELFSEVAKTYNKHVAALGEARRIFEQDLQRVNELVYQHAEEICGRNRS